MPPREPYRGKKASFLETTPRSRLLAGKAGPVEKKQENYLKIVTME
jgi:hypothetical protein